MPQSPHDAAATDRPRTRRRVGLDVARGLMLVVSVAVNAWYTAPAWFEHAPWIGVHPVDLVFPAFVTLSGCGLAYAYGRGVDVRATVRRVVVLLVVGLVVNAYVDYLPDRRLDWGELRWTGVLQLYAVIVALVAVAHTVLRSALVWLATTVALALAQATWLAQHARTCADGVLTPACNPSALVDPAVLPAAHLYAAGARGHDPEGLVVVLGALVTASVGVTIGHLLAGRVLPARLGAGSFATAARRPLARVLLGLGVCAGFGLLGLELADGIPLMKRLWTAPFALMTAGAVTAVLVVLDAILDGPPGSPHHRHRLLEGALTPLIALGRNSLLVYFGSHELVYALVVTKGSDGRPVAASLADAAGSFLHVGPALGLVLVAVAAWTLLATVLHRYGIYVRP